MKRGIGIGLFIICLLAISIASAEIFIGQPSSSVYNIGDNLGINASLSSGVKKTDYLSASLVCSGKIVEIYRSAFSVQAGEQKNVDIEVGIEPGIIGDLRGECVIEVLYGNEKAVSRQFGITSGVDVDFDVEGVAFNPKENVIISGTAIKQNRQPLNGFIIIDIEGINLTASQKVEGGRFNATFVIPDNAPSGSYVIKAIVYEKDGDLVTNQGESSNMIKINRILQDLRLTFGNLSIIPGNEFFYSVYLYDQSKSPVEEDVEIIILKPDKTVFRKNLIKSGINNNILIGYNYTPGYWNIDAKLGELKESKLFLVEELEKANFRLENNTLVVTNIGNVPYKKPIEVSIGGVTDVKEVELDMGESKQLKLGAPDGDYDIAVSDGENKYDLGRTFLTGRVIGIDNISDVLLGDMMIWVWILLIIILIIAILILVRRIRKRKFIGKTPQIISPVRKINDDFSDKMQTSSAIGGAVMEKGKREEASVIALKIKNLKDLQKTVGVNPLESLEKALLRVKAAGAKIYVDEDYRIIIFAPSITKEKENEIRAISAASDIRTILQNSNKVTSNKIDYGIGINSGEMAVESRAGKFKFVSLGNTIAIAKRVAEHSKEELLLSEPIHRKTFGKVRVEKVQGANFWKVKQIMDRSNYEEFINRFLNRQKAERKGI